MWFFSINACIKLLDRIWHQNASHQFAENVGGSFSKLSPPEQSLTWPQPPSPRAQQPQEDLDITDYVSVPGQEQNIHQEICVGHMWLIKAVSPFQQYGTCYSHIRIFFIMLETTFLKEQKCFENIIYMTGPIWVTCKPQISGGHEKCAWGS